MKKDSTKTIYHLHVALRDSQPSIWRRFHVSSSIMLPRLHRVLQIIMGWENRHLHEFRIRGKLYAPSDPEDDHFERKVNDERRVRLGAVLPEPGATFQYIYDFGDNWRHDIHVEAITPPAPRKHYPLCVDGARRCPPEDVSGMDGYEQYLTVLKDPLHIDHDEMLAWRGRINPELFSLARVNGNLRKAFPSPYQKPRTLAPKVRKDDVLDLEAILSSVLQTRRLPRKVREVVGPDDKVPLRLSARERELIAEHSFAGPELTDRLRDPFSAKATLFYYTLEELDELMGYVASEANHAEKKTAKKEWQGIFDRIFLLMDDYKQAG